MKTYRMFAEHGSVPKFQIQSVGHHLLIGFKNRFIASWIMRNKFRSRKGPLSDGSIDLSLLRAYIARDYILTAMDEKM
jgi:hypothetical protein